MKASRRAAKIKGRCNKTDDLSPFVPALWPCYSIAVSDPGRRTSPTRSIWWCIGVCLKACRACSSILVWIMKHNGSPKWDHVPYVVHSFWSKWGIGWNLGLTTPMDKCCVWHIRFIRKCCSFKCDEQYTWNHVVLFLIFRPCYSQWDHLFYISTHVEPWIYSPVSLVQLPFIQIPKYFVWMHAWLFFKSTSICVSSHNISVLYRMWQTPISR